MERRERWVLAPQGGHPTPVPRHLPRCTASAKRRRCSSRCFGCRPRRMPPARDRRAGGRCPASNRASSHRSRSSWSVAVGRLRGCGGAGTVAARCSAPCSASKPGWNSGASAFQWNAATCRRVRPTNESPWRRAWSRKVNDSSRASVASHSDSLARSTATGCGRRRRGSAARLAAGGDHLVVSRPWPRRRAGRRGRATPRRDGRRAGGRLLPGTRRAHRRVADLQSRIWSGSNGARGGGAPGALLSEGPCAGAPLADAPSRSARRRSSTGASASRTIGSVRARGGSASPSGGALDSAAGPARRRARGRASRAGR